MSLENINSEEYIKNELIEFKTQFLELIKIAKKIKKPIIQFQDEFLVGVDYNFNLLSTITYDTTKFNLFKLLNYKNLKLVFSMNNLLAWLKNNDFMDENVIITEHGILKRDDIFLSDDYSKNIIEAMFYRIHMYMYHEGVKTLENFPIREDETFENLLKLKSKDGVVFYNLKGTNYIIPMFSSLHAVTKSDKLLVDVYDLKSSKSFFMDFYIKKKNEEVHEYIRFRDLTV